jgi:hypothetical protein
VLQLARLTAISLKNIHESASLYNWRRQDMWAERTNTIVSLFAAYSLTVPLPGCTEVRHYTVGDPSSPAQEAATLPMDDRSKEVYSYYTDSIAWCQNKERSLLAANTGLNAGTDFLL